MPYELFKGSYAKDDDVRPRRVKTSRQERPKSEWGIHDAIDEFRDRYREKYPNASPDDFGNKVVLSKILGKLRKEGVSVPQMVSAIDDFYFRKLDRSYADRAAWKKWLWCVRDTRPKDEREFVAQQDKAHREFTRARVRNMPRTETKVPTSTDKDLARLAKLRLELAKAEEDEELYLANNGPASLTTLKFQIARIEERVKEG